MHGGMRGDTYTLGVMNDGKTFNSLLFPYQDNEIAAILLSPFMHFYYT